MDVQSNECGHTRLCLITAARARGFDHPLATAGSLRIWLSPFCPMKRLALPTPVVLLTTLVTITTSAVAPWPTEWHLAGAVPGYYSLVRLHLGWDDDVYRRLTARGARDAVSCSIREESMSRRSRRVRRPTVRWQSAKHRKAGYVLGLRLYVS